MSTYRHSHQPEVIARKLASGLPLRNDYTREGYIRVLEQIGRCGIRHMTLQEAWIAVRDALRNDDTREQATAALRAENWRRQ